MYLCVITSFILKLLLSQSFRTMSNLHSSSIIAAAIGATIGVLGAATLLIYQKILEQRQLAMMNDYVENVDRRLDELEAELESVRYVIESGYT